MPDEPLFGGEKNDAEKKTDVALAGPSDQIIVSIDGIKRPRRLGEPVEIIFAKKKWQIKPFSSRVYYMLRKLMDATLSNTDNLRSATNKILLEAWTLGNKLKTAERKTESNYSDEEMAAIVEVGNKISSTYNNTTDISIIMDEGVHRAAQLILYHSENPESPFFKKGEVPPEDLDGVITLDKIADAPIEDIENLMSIYAKLNKPRRARQDFFGLKEIM